MAAPVIGKSTAEVRVGGGATTGGYSFFAPIGSTRPAKIAGALDPAYLDLGYVTDDGISVKLDSSTDKILDWNLDTIAVIQKSNECSIEVTFGQVGGNVSKLLFGDANVAVDSASGKLQSISYTGEILAHRQFAFLGKDGNGPFVLDIGDGQVTGVDDISFKKTGIVQFKTTIELFKDKNGKFFNWLLADAA